jgi:hypothetical protein
VLAGDPRYDPRVIALRALAVTAAAELRVEARTLPEQLAISLTGRPARLEAVDVRRHIGDGLGIAQVMAVREMLHAQIPAAIVPIIDQLLPEHREVLSADAGHLSVGRAAAVGPVTGRAGVEQVRAVIEVRRAAPDLGQLLLGAREGLHEGG